MTRLSRGTAGRIVTVRDGTFKGMWGGVVTEALANQCATPPCCVA
jgi:hypothetical protein